MNKISTEVLSINLQIFLIYFQDFLNYTLEKGCYRTYAFQFV